MKVNEEKVEKMFYMAINGSDFSVKSIEIKPDMVSFDACLGDFCVKFVNPNPDTKKFVDFVNEWYLTAQREYEQYDVEAEVLASLRAKKTGDTSVPDAYDLVVDAEYMQASLMELQAGLECFRDLLRQIAACEAE